MSSRVHEEIVVLADSEQSYPAERIDRARHQSAESYYAQIFIDDRDGRMAPVVSEAVEKADVLIIDPSLLLANDGYGTASAVAAFATACASTNNEHSVVVLTPRIPK